MSNIDIYLMFVPISEVSGWHVIAQLILEFYIFSKFWNGLKSERKNIKLSKKLKITPKQVDNS